MLIVIRSGLLLAQLDGLIVTLSSLSASVLRMQRTGLSNQVNILTHFAV